AETSLGHQQRGTSETMLQILDLVGVMTEGGTYVPPAVQAQDDSPLGAVLQALITLQARSALKASKLQDLIGDIAGAVQSGLEALGNTTEDLTKAGSFAGKLVSVVDTLLPELKSSYALVARGRDLVGALLPPEVLKAATEDALHRDASELTP